MTSDQRFSMYLLGYASIAFQFFGWVNDNLWLKATGTLMLIAFLHAMAVSPRRRDP